MGRNAKHFNFKSINKSLFVLAILLVTAGCQDHHFVPMEKAGDLKLMGTENGNREKTFAETGPAQKEVMTDAYGKNVNKVPVFEESSGKTLTEVMTAKNKKPPITGVIAAGRIALGPEQSGRDFSGYTVYVIARLTNRRGPPLAVSRYAAGKFPIDFRLDESNIMMGDMPSAGEMITVEARLDKDGDVGSKDPGDVYGILYAPVAAGSNNISVVMNKDR